MLTLAAAELASVMLTACAADAEEQTVPLRRGGKGAAKSEVTALDDRLPFKAHRRPFVTRC